MTAPTLGQEMRAGGRVMVGSLLGIGTGVSSLMLYTNGLFVASLQRDIGLTRTQFGLGVLLVTIALALANPIVGWAVDRFGVRKPPTFGLVALAAGFALLATATRSKGSYLAIQAAVAFIAAASGPTAYVKAVSGWFNRHRGLALGITLMGIGLTAAVVPPIVARVIAAHGWRTGYALLAAIALLGLVPLLVAVRLPASQRERSSQAVAGMTPRQAMRAPAFWLLMAGFAIMALGFAGLLPHFVPMLGGLGIPPVEAAGLAALIGLAVIGSRIVTGALVDRFPATWVAIGVCLLCAAGCLILLVAGRAGAAVGALALGLAMGGEVDLIGYMVGRYFGLADFGRIYGWFYAVFILASGISPLWMGMLFDRTGSYRLALIVTCGLLMVASLIFLLVPRPRAEEALR